MYQHRHPRFMKRRKNPYAVALGKLGGQRGGYARAMHLTRAQRSALAAKAARARWAKTKEERTMGDIAADVKILISRVEQEHATALGRVRTLAAQLDALRGLLNGQVAKPPLTAPRAALWERVLDTLQQGGTAPVYAADVARALKRPTSAVLNVARGPESSRFRLHKLPVQSSTRGIACRRGFQWGLSLR